MKPCAELRRGLRLREDGQVEMERRSTATCRFTKREEGTTGEGSVRDDQRGIGVADVERGADRGIGRLGLLETGVSLRDQTVFSEATLGNPTAGLKATLERDVQCGPIGTRLPARDDRSEHFDSVQGCLTDRADQLQCLVTQPAVPGH